MSTTTDTTDLREELAVAITNVRGGAGAGKMADELLKRDSEDHALIGVDVNGQAAYFYEPHRWSITAVPYDRTGCDGLDKVRVERFDSMHLVERWVKEQGTESFAWIHPRYRWIHDMTLPEISDFS